MDASLKVAELKAARGIAWFAEAFQFFRKAPLAWIGLCAGAIAITFALFLIPFIGGVLANFLQPVFFASFAIAAYRQSAGERLVMGDLFGGFKRNMRALVILGAILLLAEMAIFFVMMVLGLPMAPQTEGFTVADYVETLKGKEWILATGLVLTLVVKGALWFAPPLIAFHGMSAFEAIRWSVYAAISNLGPLIAYCLALGGLFLVGMLTWGLGLILVIPMAAISTYIGYRDVFEAPGPPSDGG